MVDTPSDSANELWAGLYSSGTYRPTEIVARPTRLNVIDSSVPTVALGSVQRDSQVGHIE